MAPEERRYTVAQANRLLPALSRVLRSLLDELGQATNPGGVEQIRAGVGHNGGGPAASAMLAAGRRAAQQMAFLEEHGILLRDLNSGLVDFPSSREGQAVFLCWRLGEAEIGFWHPRSSGFADRRPL
ncbi:MAG: DUF2203 domain-containing protein [Candidatus Dormibacteria bacterium]